MNYRHAYHAGNFADVVKHIVFARVLDYFKLKPAPFRVIDTHAGPGTYDLRGVEAGKTGEWRDGILRVLKSHPPDDIAGLLESYLDAVQALNGPLCDVAQYPGSPQIALHALRSVDQLVANELHPEDAAHLKLALKKATNAKALSLDGYQAVKSLLPPREKRGVVLIDPPFEKPDEFVRLAGAIDDGLARFSSGVFLIWYPVKDIAAADGFVAQATARPGLKYLDARLAISDPFPELGLTQTGLLVINPPYTLAGDLRRLLPWLQGVLANGGGGGWSLVASDG